MFCFKTLSLYTRYNQTGWRLGPTAGLDNVEKKNNLPLPEIKPRFLCHPVRTSAVVPTELSRLLQKPIKVTCNKYAYVNIHQAVDLKSNTKYNFEIADNAIVMK